MANASAALLRKLEDLAQNLRRDELPGYADWVEALILESEVPTGIARSSLYSAGKRVPAHVEGKRCRPVAWDLTPSEYWADVVPLDKNEEPSGPPARISLLLFGGHTVVAKLYAVQSRRAGKGYQGVFPPGYQSSLDLTVEDERG